MFSTTDHPDAPPLTGRCYCAKTTLSASESAQVVAYCHCAGCRRLSGAPVAAFAAFGGGILTIVPPPQHAAQVSDGVNRWFCAGCGAAVAATYDYLPEQVYVPVGLWDQVDDLAPASHSHAASAVSWLHLSDDLPRHMASGRDALSEQAK